ncbi:hypothetical protein Lal_00033635 [Lupinus albus]|nr:hypothetical protein Lal_00033635 [Lupinus albus]
MTDVNESKSFNIVSPEFLNSLTIFGILNHKIKLKGGTPIILLRNLDQYEGSCGL